MDFNYVVVPALVLLSGVMIVWLSIRRILSLSSKSYRKWRKVTERVVLSAISIVVAVIATTAVFNAIALYSFRPLFIERIRGTSHAESGYGTTATK